MVLKNVTIISTSQSTLRLRYSACDLSCENVQQRFSVEQVNSNGYILYYMTFIILHCTASFIFNWSSWTHLMSWGLFFKSPKPFQTYFGSHNSLHIFARPRFLTIKLHNPVPKSSRDVRGTGLSSQLACELNWWSIAEVRVQIPFRSCPSLLKWRWKLWWCCQSCALL